MTMSKMILIGNLGSDPEMRYAPSGDPVTNFSVAVNWRSRGRDGQEPVEKTDWFRVSAWGRLAETTNQFLAKGSKVYVEGRFSTSTWTGQDGQMRVTNEVRAQDVQFLTPRGQTDSVPGGAPPPPGVGGSDDEDDLPW